MQEITNTSWRLESEGGPYVNTIRAASNGGGKVLLDPWGGEIPNSVLEPLWDESGDCGPEIVAWRCSIPAGGGVANLYMQNV